ncbi:hypothetical protein KR009_003782, partial [Drosophila setifemur]
MILGRGVIGFTQSKTCKMQRRMSDQRRPYQRQVVSVRLGSRPNTSTDLKRPPFLLVKSFLNLRHLVSDEGGKDASNVTDELSFQVHRTLLVGLLKKPEHSSSDAEGLAEMVKLRDSPGSVPDSGP